MTEVNVQESKLRTLFLAIDRDLAAKARSAGCKHKDCGGTLHSAQYPRKMPGASNDTERDPDETRRFSFCCETCRRRTTPPSVRFLGRRVYPAVLVLMLSALRDGMTGNRARQLRDAFGVARRTLERWRRWWREIFVETRFWNYACGLFTSPLDPSAMPACLIDQFQAAELQARLIQCLRFLGPLTAPGDHAI